MSLQLLKDVSRWTDRSGEGSFSLMSLLWSFLSARCRRSDLKTSGGGFCYRLAAEVTRRKPSLLCRRWSDARLQLCGFVGVLSVWARLPLVLLALRWALHGNLGDQCEPPHHWHFRLQLRAVLGSGDQPVCPVRLLVLCLGSWSCGGHGNRGAGFLLRLVEAHLLHRLLFLKRVPALWQIELSHHDQLLGSFQPRVPQSLASNIPPQPGEIGPRVGASAETLGLGVAQQVSLTVKWHFQRVPARRVRLPVGMIPGGQLLCRLYPLEKRGARWLGTARPDDVSHDGRWGQSFAVVAVKGFGEARQRRGRALWRKRLGGGRVACQRRGGDVTGGLAATHLGVPLRAQLGA